MTEHQGELKGPVWAAQSESQKTTHDVTAGETMTKVNQGEPRMTKKRRVDKEGRKQ